MISKYNRLHRLHLSPANPLGLFGFLCLWLAVTVLVVVFFTHAAIARAENDAGRQVVLVLIDRLALEDINPGQMPELAGLVKQGALGLMNTNTVGPRTPENGSATIGAGRVASAGPDGNLAFNTGETYLQEKAGTVFYRRTGRPAPPDGVVFPGLAALQRANQTAGTGALPGALGSALHQAGLKTGVIGNADLPGEAHRQAVLVAMDAGGVVDYGDVGSSLLRREPDGLLEWRTDYQRLLDAYERVAAAGASLVVVETGDSSRVEIAGEDALTSVTALERRRVLQETDAFVARLVKRTTPGTLLIILSVVPPRAALDAKQMMTPLLLLGDDITPGLLTSGSTRRPGIVTNMDVAPTILRYLGAAAPPDIPGRPVRGLAVSSGGVDAYQWLLGLQQRMAFTYRVRPLLVKPYVVMQIIVVAAALMGMFSRVRLLRYFTPVLLGLMVVPLVLLALGGIAQYGFGQYMMTAVLVTLLAVLAAIKWTRRVLWAFTLVSLATTAALAGDLLAGATLMQNSTLGYDPMSGARYYGMGNEFMGVLLGSAIIGFSGLYQLLPRCRKGLLPLSAALMAGLIYLLASPAHGSNVGGTIAAMAGFSVTLLSLRGSGFTWSRLLTVVVAGVALLFAFAATDMTRDPEVQSHLGRTAAQIRREGLGVLQPIIARKLAMNLKLIRLTIWSRVFLVTLLTTIVLFFRPVGVFTRIRQDYPFLFSGLVSVLVAAVTALVGNDSGIVAAATMMIFGAAPMIYLAINEKETAEKGQPTKQNAY